MNLICILQNDELLAVMHRKKNFLWFLKASLNIYICHINMYKLTDINRLYIHVKEKIILNEEDVFMWNIIKGNEWTVD